MAEAVLTTDMFEAKLRETLQSGLSEAGIRCTVETEPVATTRLFRALVIGRQFARMGQMERQEVVWRILQQALSPEEQLRVSMVLTVTPSELGLSGASDGHGRSDRSRRNRSR